MLKRMLLPMERCAVMAGLDLEIAHEITRDVVEGLYHTGRAAVVQICGHKRAR